jgi:hypothetical protein
MGRVATRNIAGTFGVLGMAGGATLMGYDSQVNSLCGSIALVPGSGDCGQASAGYYGGIALLLLGVVLLIGAFILSLRIVPWSERPLSEGRRNRHRATELVKTDGPG